MSSVYKSLSTGEDLRIEKDSLNELEKKLQPAKSAAGLKVSIVITLLLSIASLAGTAYLYQSLNAERRERQALETSQIQIQEKSVSLEKSAKAYEEKIKKLEEQVRDAGTAKQQLTVALEQGRKQIAELQGRITAIEEKNRAIEEQAAKYDSEFAEEEAEIPVASVSPAGVAAIDEAAVSAVKTPRVLTVNRKFNFIVVNVGLRDDLKMGDSVKILRDGKTVGSASVEKIYDNFAAANIVKEPKDAPIKEGDSISIG